MGCHPLFDHNNAFDIDFMRDMDAPYQFGEMTIKQAALKAMKEVDFHFTAPITRADFITERQYLSFKKRAACLGLKVERREDLWTHHLAAINPLPCIGTGWGTCGTGIGGTRFGR